jgi:glutamine amidotransferase
MGNLRSVERALRAALGEHAQVTTTDDAGVVRESDVVVVPGQGAFGDCSLALHRGGGALARAICTHIDAGKRYLGICLGLQALFEGSEEARGARGLGVFRGEVQRLRDGLHDPDGTRVKVPHMGWNEVTSRNIAAMSSRAWFYFVHSYHVVPADPARLDGLATATHGETFVAAVCKGALLGVQFHPEKSQRAGIELLRDFYATGATR